MFLNMSDSDDNKAGPSGVKRQRIMVRNSKTLTTDEMLMFLQDSDDEDENFVSNTDDDSESEVERNLGEFKMFILFYLVKFVIILI